MPGRGKRSKTCKEVFADGTKCTRPHVAHGQCGAHYARSKLGQDMGAPFIVRTTKKMRRSIAAKEAWARRAAEKSPTTEFNIKVSDPSSEKLYKLVVVTGMDVQKLAGRILENALKTL